MTDDHWADVLDTNLTGAFHTIRRATPEDDAGPVRSHRQRLVGERPERARRARPTTRRPRPASLGLTRAVARELAPRGITCNVVAPGPIVTAMTDGLPDEWRTLGREHGAARAPRAPRRRCAAVVAFLCSDAAGYVTGALVPVDGGLGMGH